MILIIFLIYVFNIRCEGREPKFNTAYKEFLFKEKIKRKEPPIKRIHSPWENEYDKAEEYFAKGRYEKAIEIYQKMMKRYPNEKRKKKDYKDKYLYLRIASCYEKLHQFSKAYQIYSNLIKEYQDKDEIYEEAKYGVAFIDKYKLIEIEEKRKNKDIDESDFLLKLVNVFMDEGRDREDTFPLIEKAFKLNPNHPEILLRLGQVYNRKGDEIIHYSDPAGEEYSRGKDYKNDAEGIFYRIIREYPRSEFADDAQYCLAEQYYYDAATIIGDKSYDYKRAIREYEKVINQYPESELCLKAQLGIANCYRCLNDYHQAIKEYKKVIEKYPTTEEAITAQRNIGISYVALKDYEEAIKVFQELIDNFPKSEEAGLSLLDRAEVYEKYLKDYNKAIELYEEYIHNYAKREIDKEVYQEEIIRLKKKL